jgi:oxygen-independent coproporphyrinogen-3 oxidase
VTSVFVGGGTPTLLPPGDLARLLARLRELLPFAPGAEVTVEANPETVDAAMAEGLAAAGVTRVSMGAQSFDDRVLAALGRVHDAAGSAGRWPPCGAPGCRRSTSTSSTAGRARTPARGRPPWSAAVALGPSTCRPTPSPSSRPPSSAAWSPPAAWPSRARTTSPTATTPPARSWPRRLRPLRGLQLGPRPRPQRQPPHNLTYWRRGRYLGLGRRGARVRRDHPALEPAGVPPYLAAVHGGRRPTEGEERLDAGQARFEALALRLRTVDGLGPTRPGPRVDPAGDEATTCAPPACWPRDRPAP